ncbi:MAG: glycoside hydrolase family 99-like domain-containing protein, partial [Anaerolineae bacterium]
PQEVGEGLRYELDVHAQLPADFHYNGKPVFFFWYQQRYSLDDWAAIRQQVDPNRESIWIAEGIATDAVGVFDGLHLYTIAWAENVYGTQASWASTVRGRGGLWVATAMPGWDNTYTQQSERYVRERGEGAFYRDTFAAAASTNPAMVVITSWNEWWEGTHIEPSVRYGDFYLNLTGTLIAEFKGSGAVAGGGSQPPVFAPEAEVPPSPTSLPPTLPPTITPTAKSPTPAIPSPTLAATPAQVGEAAPLEPTETPPPGLVPTPSPAVHEWIVPTVGGGVLFTGLAMGTAAVVLLAVRRRAP